MRRASQFRAAGEWSPVDAVHSIVLGSAERHRRRLVLPGQHGTKVLLDLPRAVTLRDGDALVLDDGALLRVVRPLEPLTEIAAASAHDLARHASHLGIR